MNIYKKLFQRIKPLEKVDVPKENPQERPEEIILQDLRKQWIYPTTYCEPGDVFIASYPKSGVTWLRHMTTSLIYGMDASKVPDILVNTIFPDLHAFKYYLRTGMPLVFKTHALPSPEMRRVVHLVRDGRDVIASYYAMLKNQGYTIDLEDMIKNGTGLFPCDWLTHCSEWLKNPYGAEICLITYEELQLDPVKTVSKYCDFIGLNVSEEKILQAISESKFEKMQQKEIDQGWGPNKPMLNGLFVRSGKIGGYKNELTEDLIKEFNKINSAVLTRFGYPIDT